MRVRGANVFVALFVLVFAWGCSDDAPEQIVDPGNDQPAFDVTTCIGCHSSEEALKAALGPTSQVEAATLAASDG